MYSKFNTKPGKLFHKTRHSCGMASALRVLGITCLLSIVLGTVTYDMGPVAAAYLATNRDTRLDPEALPTDIPWENRDDYLVLYENDNFIYSFKEYYQIVAITDKRNGYTWTSGLDIMTDREVDELNDEAEEAGEVPPYLPREERLNTIYTGIANSLVSFEFYDNANNIRRSSIGRDDRVRTEFLQVADDHYIIRVDHREPEVEFDLHIRFTDTGLSLSIPAEDMVIDEDSRLSAIILAPFLGATGGVQVHWDEADQSYSNRVPREMKPGYILVPDGSGALIRFRDNQTELEAYQASVYGTDPTQHTYFYQFTDNAIPQNNPVMPVFGIAHGQNQNAFVAYATEGAEYMQVVVQPEENMTYYYYAYPRFSVNPLFYQPYNQRGDGFFTMMDEANLVDISMNYDFLAGDGSGGEPAANYVGMAKQYQSYLIENDLLAERLDDVVNEDIPIRLDFIMADAEKAVIGYRDAVLSTASDVQEMLDYFVSSGLYNLNASLLGWQKGGYTLARPDRARFTRSIGNKSAFSDLFQYTADMGIDLSLYQDYSALTGGQMGLYNNAVKHVNGQYVEETDYGLHIPDMYFARPTRSLEWLDRQLGRLSFLDLDSHSIAGISDTLMADYRDSSSIVTRAESKESIVQAIGELSEDYNLSLNTPNDYLWRYTDRFLQAPVYSSQHLIQTDNVPFLQLVLNNHMEVYGPYSNFSFYTQSDILRMIDYNVYPSFVLTKESAHLLAETNLVSYYSTEFSFYQELILDVYETVNRALSRVQGAEWINREVLEPGLIRNHYSNGVTILINFTDSTVSVDGQTVEALSFLVLENGEEVNHAS